MTRRFVAVLWDIDGTLVDSEPTHERALDDVLERYGPRLSDEARARTIGTTAADTHAILASLYPGLPDLPAFVAAKTAAYLARRSEIVLRYGVREALDWLQTQSVACGFVSNSDRVIVAANLNSAGFAASDLVRVTRDDVSRGKPHPEPYLLAAERLGVAPPACLVIEDSAIGAAAGLAAGMAVIGWPAAAQNTAAFPAGCTLADPFDLVAALAAAFR